MSSPLAGRRCDEHDGHFSGDMSELRRQHRPLPAGMPMTGGRAVDFITRTALDAQMSSDEVRGIAARVQNQSVYPNSPLANSLKLVAKLIGGGLPTRIYYVSQGGYDTHTNQINTQQRLLQDLGDSTKAFVEDMKAQGNMQRVLVMTFSEFGRRVAENANGGTDHGAAAPMFIVATRLRRDCSDNIRVWPRKTCLKGTSNTMSTSAAFTREFWKAG